jgi:CRISPR/Cas system-associated exonuclease Cas4 (RecB family)
LPLATLEDLKREPPDVVAGYLRWAGELGEMWERFLREDDEDESFTVSWGSSKGRAAGIHASEISGCQRRCVYTQLKTEKRDQPKAFWKRKFRSGHLYHQLNQRDFHRMCAKTNGLVRFEDEIRVHPDLQTLAMDLDIHSSCDGCFTFLEDVGGPPIMRVGVEIKSASPDEWTKLKKPKDEHLEQACLYQRLLDIPVMWVIYINKGTQVPTKSESPWIYTYDEQLWNKLEARMRDRQEDARQNRLPDRLEGIGCEFCPYSWTCEPEYLKKKERMEEGKRARTRVQQRSRLLRANR